MPQLKEGRFLKLSPYAIWSAVIIAVAVGIRVALINQGWPLLDSDEGVMGLMGIHIAFKGELPVFFYAQGYMGSAEAFLAAAFFRLFGISDVNLRLGLILIYTIFMIGMYLLTSLLYSRKVALITLLFLCFGSNPMLMRELIAVGGVPETMFGGAFLMLLAAWLALTSSPPGTVQKFRWKRLLLFALWGLIAGFGVWSHLLIAPFILTSGLLLVIFCWPEVRRWGGLIALLGLILGAWPLIAYNFTAPPGKSTIDYFLNVMSATGVPQPPPGERIVRQLKGTFLIALPTVSGANPLCYGSTAKTPVFRFGDFSQVSCTFMHTGWSLAVILLWAIAVMFCLVSLRRLYRQPITPELRKERIIQWARLALLVNSLIPVALYVVSANPAIYPVATSRYLTGLIVTTPALLWVLIKPAEKLQWLVVRGSFPLKWNMSLTSTIFRRCCLIFALGIYILGTFSTFTGIPPQAYNPREEPYFTQNGTQHYDVPFVQKLNWDEGFLIRQLGRWHIDRIYSDYWTCNRIIFRSKERVICSVLNEKLNEGHNRYYLYYQKVKMSDRVAYVFRPGSAQDKTFQQYMKSNDPRYKQYKNYVRKTITGYIIYLPK
ncbi:hypothetical protein EI42_02554 [Thermosporothrix hazakensis]|jgi:hypothetical protein|uniref:Glycosyltransferase RgtA/B/C/D-like domain-containing protein n=1 Tax=Thermosporothrix hazakensis TaxID=644383 RepID=A0A326U971_THEHA|nr:hypothetical protein [Thermosporothrix hazakensis]PZW30582.1 hypothetical protein EI42_02554 [Thermosporothrix hazakensis]GCE49444.1 hypothetical protein KTH_43130 [Thermosporothrix hazakensis]